MPLQHPETAPRHSGKSLRKRKRSGWRLEFHRPSLWTAVLLTMNFRGTSSMDTKTYKTLLIKLKKYEKWSCNQLEARAINSRTCRIPAKHTQQTLWSFKKVYTLWQNQSDIVWIVGLVSDIVWVYRCHCLVTPIFLFSWHAVDGWVMLDVHGYP